MGPAARRKLHRRHYYAGRPKHRRYRSPNRRTRGVRRLCGRVRGTAKHAGLASNQPSRRRSRSRNGPQPRRGQSACHHTYRPHRAQTDARRGDRSGSRHPPRLRLFSGTQSARYEAPQRRRLGGRQQPADLSRVSKTLQENPPPPPRSRRLFADEPAAGHPEHAPQGRVGHEPRQRRRQVKRCAKPLRKLYPRKLPHASCRRRPAPTGYRPRI